MGHLLMVTVLAGFVVLDTFCLETALLIEMAADLCTSVNYFL